MAFGILNEILKAIESHAELVDGNEISQCVRRSPISARRSWPEVDLSAGGVEERAAKIVVAHQVALDVEAGTGLAPREDSLAGPMVGGFPPINPKFRFYVRVFSGVEARIKDVIFQARRTATWTAIGVRGGSPLAALKPTPDGLMGWSERAITASARFGHSVVPLARIDSSIVHR